MQPITDADCARLALEMVDQVNIKAADAEAAVAVKDWIRRQQAPPHPAEEQLTLVDDPQAS